MMTLTVTVTELSCIIISTTLNKTKLSPFIYSNALHIFEQTQNCNKSQQN